MTRRLWNSSRRTAAGLTQSAVASALGSLVDDADLRRRMGAAARARAVAVFAYDVLARRLGTALDGLS
jgi:hypothetical protein